MGQQNRMSHMTQVGRNPATRTRRSLIGNVAASLRAGAALAACGAGGGSTTGSLPPSGTVAPATITFANPGNDFYTNAPYQSFRQKSPQVTVEHMPLPAGVQYLEKMLALLSAGTPPDVWDIGQGTINEYQQKGEMLVLDQYIARDRSIDFADFEPSSMYHLDGKRHMLPRDTGVSALYYNADLWQRVGLPNPRQLWLERKWDWPAFLDAARKLSGDDPSGRRYGIGLIGAPPWVLGVWLWQNGTDFADWAANRQTIDRPATVEALQWVIDLAQRHRVMPTAAAAGSEGPSFANGRYAMVQDFSFARANYMKMDGLKWDVAPLPRGKGGTAAVHVARNGFGISAKTKRPEASWLWMTHITGKDVARLATQEGRVHPPRKSVAGSDVFLKPSGVAADFRPFVEQQPFGQFGAPHEKRGEINALLGPRVNAAYDGQVSAQALATEIAPQVQQVLSQGKGFPDPKK